MRGNGRACDCVCQMAVTADTATRSIARVESSVAGWNLICRRDISVASHRRRAGRDFAQHRTRRRRRRTRRKTLIFRVRLSSEFGVNIYGSPTVRVHTVSSSSFFSLEKEQENEKDLSCRVSIYQRKHGMQKTGKLAELWFDEKWPFLIK